MESRAALNDGKHCPSCRNDIGIWSIFAAGLPSRITCPHCRRRLAYAGVTGIVVAMVVLVAIIGGASYLAAQRLSGDGAWLLPFALFLLGAWVPIELVVAFFLRARRTLVARS